MSAPPKKEKSKLHLPEAEAINAELAKVSPGSARHTELLEQKKALYKSKANQ
jgi:hypothetical protein